MELGYADVFLNRFDGLEKVEQITGREFAVVGVSQCVLSST